MEKQMKNKLRKDRILLSAVAVIKRKGYTSTKMEDIATELEMTKGSLYYYFKNKKDLMYQCHEAILNLAIAEAEELLREGNDAEKTLREMVAVHIKYAIEEKEIFNLIIEPKHAFNKEHIEPVLKLRKYYSSLYDQVIKRGLENGEFKVENPMIVRMIILGSMNWIQQWYQAKGKMSESEIKASFGDYIIKLLK